MIPKSTKPKALWMKVKTPSTKAALARLRPERSKAGGVKARSYPEIRRMQVYNRILELFNVVHQICEGCKKIHAAYGVGDPEPHWRETNHHIIGRDGLNLFDPKYFLPCCLWAHKWIDDHREEAREIGLLAPTGEWNTQPKATHE